MENNSALASLWRRWGLLVLSALFLLIGGYALLAFHLGSALALRWLLPAGLALGYQLAVHWPDLALNHHPEQKELLPELGPGTLLSLVRLLGVGLLTGFLFIPWPLGWLAWLPLTINLICNLSDFLDGYAARVSEHVTRLGDKLDMDLDGRNLLVATLLSYHYGNVPWWFLAVGFARYLFIFGSWMRMRRGLPIHDLQPSAARRAFAGVQMGFSTAMLAPAFSPPETTVAATLFMIPFLANFTVDWLQVSGRSDLVQGLSSGWQRGRTFFARWGALVFRLAAVAVLVFHSGKVGQPWQAIEFLLGLAILLGAAGRVAAALLLIETGFRLQAAAPSAFEWLLILSGTVMLFAGTGAFSLWRPEDLWIRRRAGEAVDIE